jgi:hypothetical protein
MEKRTIPLVVFLVLALSFFHWSYGLNLIFFNLGLFLGFLLYDLDHFIYCFWQFPQELTPQRVKYLVNQKQYRQAFFLVWQTRKERTKTIFHSVFFQTILLIVCFLILFSSPSLFGKGIILGLFGHSLMEQGIALAKNETLDNWFWQFREKPATNIQGIYFAFLFLLFLIFSLLLV